MRLRTTFSILACGIVLLGACAEQSSPPAPPANAPAPQVVAVAKGRVDIEGGLVRLAGTRDGLVKAVYAEEGAVVKAGQVLAQIDDTAARLALAEAERELDEVRAEQPVLEVQLVAAKRERERLDRLVPEDAAPRQELDLARDRVNEIEATLGRQAARVALAKARVATAAQEVALRVIKAPIDGVIVKRQARLGDGVSTVNVTPLFTFAPQTPRIVRADIEERHVGKVAVGMRATVFPESDESRGYGARVVRIGAVFNTRQAGDDPTDKVDVRVVECVLLLEASPLLIGQRVIVRLLPS
jgi:RND family efflux transporter MFP subunit